MNASQSLSKLQIRAEAELRYRAVKGDSTALSYLHGYGSFDSDPLGFNEIHLKTRFTDPIKQVIESVMENTVTIAVSANAIGKSHSAAHIAVWFYKVFTDSKVFISAAPPENNLKQILWGEIGTIIHDHPHVFAEDKISEGMKIQRSSKSFISGVIIPSTGTPEQREAKFSGKHSAHLLFIVDEGDAVPPEVYKGIESCMSGGMARLLIMFNPRADIGYVANMVKKKQGKIIFLSAFDHPNVLTGVETIKGAVTREMTVRRINQWSRPMAKDEKPNLECFQTPQFLVGSIANSPQNIPYPPLPAGWRRVENPELFYKVIGVYPPQSEMQLISRAWVDMAVSRWQTYVALHGEIPPKAVFPIIGIDVADQGRDKNALTQRWGGWVAPIRTWNGIDVEQTAIKAAEIIKFLDVPLNKIKVNVDGTGVGAGVAPRMQGLKIPYAEKVMVASSPTFIARDEYGNEMGVFPQLRDQLWWSCMLWLKNDPGAMIPPDDDLIDELVAPSYEVYNGKVRISHKEKMKESLGRSPDKAESLIMTFAPDQPIAGAW